MKKKHPNSYLVAFKNSFGAIRNEFKKAYEDSICKKYTKIVKSRKQSLYK